MYAKDLGNIISHVKMKVVNIVELIEENMLNFMEIIKRRKKEITEKIKRKIEVKKLKLKRMIEIRKAIFSLTIEQIKTKTNGFFVTKPNFKCSICGRKKKENHKCKMKRTAKYIYKKLVMC